MADAPSTCVLCCNNIDNVSRFNTLLGNTSCVMCKTEMPRVICLQREDQSFESFQDWGDNIGPSHVFDEASTMFFLKEDHAKHLRKLRDPLCKKCHKKFATVAALRTHVLDVHQLQYCSICLENKKVFIGELELYTKEQLKKHNTKGNPHEGFMGHPRCDFCFSRFYSTTELYDHLRKNHFECDICLYQMQVQNRYYKDYNDLENHFRADHFLCEERDCLAKKFVVFKSHLDLQAHMTVDHPHIKTSRKIDVHFTVRRASQGDENDFEDPSLFQQQQASGSNTINVADFPSLSGSDSAAAGQSFSLWENHSATRRPRTEDFPALVSSSSSNGNGSSFRNALAPPPSAAMRAHMDNNGWEYENPELASAAAALGANNPLMRFVKPARKNKGKKKGRKPGGLEERLAAPAPVVQEEEESESEEEDVGPAPSKTAVVLKIRQVLGSDAKYEVFREDCKRFRMGEVEVPEFYAKMSDQFSTTDFSQLFLPLMRLSPDKEQVDSFFGYHKQVNKQRTKAQGFQESASKRNKKAAKQQAQVEEKAPTPRRKVHRQPPALSQSGWGNALKESGVRSSNDRKPAAIVHNTNLRSMLGRDEQPSTTWSSSSNWQAPPPAASNSSAYPSLGRTPASTKLQTTPIESFASLSVSSSSSSSSGYGVATSAYASNPTPVLREITPPPAAPTFKAVKNDFPDLPKAAKAIGVQPVTRATWDDQVQAIAQNRPSANNGGRGNGKKKQKKKSMTLGEMAMRFG
ncbi:hypothetical protein BBO99_00005593 [Phytophthora kernoviae]|uniref:C2H2-type domain-containing protein n=2 Tax=Phytophthora kernoviae TaxID=325452 RepID=A0A3R7K254_9STRA|nr:hypothetical protein G195_008688 [Phytophthora kernoviae 00238/432]KAG2522012.1 hypothetical protein JM16_005769 [Phytophthora kernoviae]KAG2524124.1 hypothetical protein JM18_005255 [Phytophthora kernoviae]RLN05818.1 hypothetical protein BBI17_005625 [Phytophthora kernoviae]RLN78970.1 hypothetical protein BBO99_00005593 [Phytophthora kernoviae]